MKIINFLTLLGIIVTLMSGLVYAQDDQDIQEPDPYLIECKNDCNAQKQNQTTYCNEQSNPAECEGDSDCVQRVNEDKSSCSTEASDEYNQCVSSC